MNIYVFALLKMQPIVAAILKRNSSFRRVLLGTTNCEIGNVVSATGVAFFYYHLMVKSLPSQNFLSYLFCKPDRLEL